MQDSSARVQLVHVLTQHQSMIQAYAYAIVRDFHLAEDVYQDVATILAERWETLPQGDGLLPWLRETTRRKALEARRRSRRMPVALSEEVLERLETHFPSREPEGPRQEDLRDMMARCVEKLERTARWVVRTRYGEGKSCEEIAQELGRTVQGVYGIVKRARLALAECADRAYPAQD